MEFETWVKVMFDAESVEEEAVDRFHAMEPADRARHLIRLFESPDFLLRDFSVQQVAAGLGEILDVWEDGGIGELVAEGVTVSESERGLRAIGTLFERVFAPHCTHYYSHLDVGPEKPHPFNGVCYMWWEAPPFFFESEDETDRRVVDAAFETLERILFQKNVACQEAAIHGLGHCVSVDAKRAGALLGRYLNRRRQRPRELVEYAEAARTGAIQ